MPKIALLAGDGIGQEVIRETVALLKIVERKSHISMTFQEAILGGQAIDQVGVPLPEETLKLCQASDAVLMGAVGGPKWDNLDYNIRPERAILGLRSELGLFANLRPARLYTPLIEASTLKREVIDGLDIMVIRELTGDLYFGKPRGIETISGQERGINTLIYWRWEIERIAKVAFEIALKRGRKVTSVDKANILESSELWRKVVIEVSRKYPQVELNHLYVDNCSMQLIRNPKQFDVIVTGNMFGDILSDEAAMLTGSIGMLPSASLGGKVALYEPVHGSAPDIAGKDLANPIAAIMSSAMMFKYSFDRNDLAEKIESAVIKVLEQGYRTKDIYDSGLSGLKLIGTKEMGAQIGQTLEGIL